MQPFPQNGTVRQQSTANGELHPRRKNTTKQAVQARACLHSALSLDCANLQLIIMALCGSTHGRCRYFLFPRFVATVSATRTDLCKQNMTTAAAGLKVYSLQHGERFILRNWTPGASYYFEAIIRFGSPYQQAYGGETEIVIPSAP